jgi:hypothetical protein
MKMRQPLFGSVINVHGNEASSSEAAMLVIYALTDPSNTKAKEWLKNTVVIIDPCIKPGREGPVCELV